MSKSKEAITVNKRGKPSNLASKDGRKKKSVEDEDNKTKDKKKEEKSKDKDKEKEKIKEEDAAEKSKNTKYTEEEKKTNRKKWAARLHEMKCKDMSKEFNDKIKRFVPSGVTMDICKTEANQIKCRYADVLCIDQTRVPLKGKSEEEDFIHANWVSAPGGTKYICTQAPLKETCEDFWHMCFKEKVSLIVMLCNFKEGSDLEKCHHYFPEKPKDKLKFGEYTVTMKEKLDEIEIEDTEFTTMEIKRKDDTVKLKHCFMRYWVDNCAPVETEPILKLWRWVRKHHADRPVAIHCSAGVGRTSTFVGIELANYRVSMNPDLNLLDVVKELRRMRYQSIQSHVQFLYLHYLVLDYFVQEKIVDPYKESKFVDEYRKHTKRRTTRAIKQAKNQGKEDAPGSKKLPDSDAEGN